MRALEISTFEFYKKRHALFSDSTGTGVYYFAQENKGASGTSWSVVRRTLDYHHSWRRWVTFHSDETIAEGVPCVSDAIEMLAKLERELQQKQGFKQKKRGYHLHYRDYVAGLGDHLDGNGKYVAVSRNEPILVDTKIENGELSSLYRKAAEKTSAQGIQTWEDFHRAVAGGLSFHSREMLAEVIDSRLVEYGEDMLARTAMLDRLIADDGASFLTRQFAVDSVVFSEDEDDESECLDYHCFAARLTALMRAGQKVCAAYMASPATESHLRILEYVTDAVRNIDGERFGFTRKMAAQATNLFTQGPDPRAGMPSPFEQVLTLRKSSKGGGPKPYSP